MNGPEFVPAIVLAGGLGTRLSTVVRDRSKVMAEVGGRPFVTLLLSRLAASGFRRAVLCTGHLAESVRSGLGSSFGPLRLDYSEEKTPLGTGGALRHALSAAPGETLLCMNGDSFCDADPAELLAAHHASGAAGTLLLARAPDTARFGRVAVDGHGRVTGFLEKGSFGPGLVNAGVYAFERRFLLSVPEGRPVSLEREVLPGWIGRGLFGHGTGARLVDIGTPESLAEAERLFGARHRFAVLDRDGTILEERHYLSRVEDVALLPGAAEGLRRMRGLGLGLVVVSNQSGVGRGLLDLPRLEEIHARMRELLRAEGVELDGIYACPHLPEEGCPCRKPLPGLLLSAGADLGFDPAEAFVIGDKECDISLGKRVGALTVLVRTGYGRSAEAAAGADFVADDLSEAAGTLETLLRHSRGERNS